MDHITVFAAFFGGVISFISPCVLPLVPAYISFISGLSLDQMRDRQARLHHLQQVFTYSLAFVLGFSLVFIVLGASATFMGQFLLARLNILTKIAGIIIVLFGLHLTGILRINMLNYEKRFNEGNKPQTIIGAFLVGLAFAFGWTPCIGPILATILAVAGTRETITEGIFLLTVYSLGLGVPFLLTAIATNTFFRFFERIKRHFQTIEMVSGVFLIAVGILIFFDLFAILSNYLARLFPWLNVG